MSKSTENKYLRPLAGAVVGTSIGGGAGYAAGRLTSVPFHMMGESVGRAATKRLGKRGLVAGSLIGLGLGTGIGMHYNKYLNKVASANNNNVQQPPVAPPDHRALKTFAKLTAVGLAGTVIGGGLGARAGSMIAKTGLGKSIGAKVESGIGRANTRFGTSMSKPSGAVAGMMIGAHAAGGVGDLLTLHHDFKQSDAQRTKQASYNKYLAKIVK